MVERFNELPTAEADEALLACCASPRWVARVIAGRPYPTALDALAVGEAAFAELTWPELAAVRAAHPRIGQRPPGPSREAVCSRREQAGVQGAPKALAQDLVEANRAYEERFGFVFLIFATGRSGEEILAAARDRLDNDDLTEQTVVRDELRKIVNLRLERLVGS